jgi:hypothetical protein
MLPITTAHALGLAEGWGVFKLLLNTYSVLTPFNILTVSLAVWMGHRFSGEGRCPY